MPTGWDLLRALAAMGTRAPKRARYAVGRNGEGAKARRKRQMEKGMLRAGERGNMPRLQGR